MGDVDFLRGEQQIEQKVLGCGGGKLDVESFADGNGLLRRCGNRSGEIGAVLGDFTPLDRTFWTSERHLHALWLIEMLIKQHADGYGKRVVQIGLEFPWREETARG